MQAVIHHPSIHEPGGIGLHSGIGVIVALAHIVVIAWLLVWGHGKLVQPEQGKALMVTMIPAPVQEQIAPPVAPTPPPPPKVETPPMVTAARQAVAAPAAPVVPVVPPEPVQETPAVEVAQPPVAAPSSTPVDAEPAVAAVPAMSLDSVRMAYLNNKMVYPPELRRQGIQGKAVLKVLVSPEGRVLSVELLCTSGNGDLDRAAMKGVRDWKFASFSGPGAVPHSAIVPINFELK